jgi:hypothetical protein
MPPLTMRDGHECLPHRGEAAEAVKHPNEFRGLSSALSIRNRVSMWCGLGERGLLQDFTKTSYLGSLGYSDHFRWRHLWRGNT